MLLVSLGLVGHEQKWQITFFPGLNTKASGGSLHSLEGKSELGLVMDGAGLGDGWSRAG